MLHTFSNLDEWLTHLEGIHPAEIELGLTRVSRVGAAVGCLRVAPLMILVGGTNGKGTTSALIAALLRRRGLRVGVYSSPHILRYNERVSIDGVDISDADLCATFAHIEAARGDTTLTYFEFGTLAALIYFQQQGVDACVMEIGLGGRLDAVNIAEADISVVTSIGLDHQSWLGDTVAEIAYEKCSIARKNCFLVCGQPDAPDTAEETVANIGGLFIGRDETFGAQLSDSGVEVRFCDGSGSPQYWALPPPKIPYPNVATAIQTLALINQLPSYEDVAYVVSTLAVPGRLQAFEFGELRLTLDVAHNPQAAEFIGQQLVQVDGIVLGMLADKDVEGVLRALPATKAFHLVSLPQCHRGLSASSLHTRADFATDVQVQEWDTVEQALDALLAANVAGHWLVAGSFYTVEAAQIWLNAQQADRQMQSSGQGVA
jgi:dihydrofolate synthase/folylpolyglutamate synthase